MKKITICIMFIFMFLFSERFIHSQWQADVRLSNNSASSWLAQDNSKSLATSGSIMHVVWQDNRDGNWEIYYVRSPDNGFSWGSETRLTINASNSVMPSVCASGTFVHLCWEDSRDGNSEVYYKRSTNGGLTWSADARLTYNSTASVSPDIIAYNSSVNIVWQDNASGNNEIYSYYSTNSGQNWSSSIRLTNDPASSEQPCINRNEQDVCCVWQDNRDGNMEIYCKYSFNEGISWYSDKRISNNSSSSTNPSVAGSGLNVYAVWQDERDGNKEIYMNSSDNLGSNWSTDRRLTNNAAGSYHPSIAVSGQTIHVVWYDERDTVYSEIYYKRSPDKGLSWSADTRLTHSSSYALMPSVAVSGGNVNVAWEDHRDALSGEIYFKSDPTGNPNGANPISTEIPEKYSLSQNYPNPFNPWTFIKFDVAKGLFVSLKIYDVLGREVAVLVNENLKPGTYEADWNASSYPSGVYFYTLRTEKFTETKRMVLVK